MTIYQAAEIFTAALIIAGLGGSFFLADARLEIVEEAVERIDASFKAGYALHELDTRLQVVEKSNADQQEALEILIRFNANEAQLKFIRKTLCRAGELDRSRCWDVIFIDMEETPDVPAFDP